MPSAAETPSSSSPPVSRTVALVILGAALLGLVVLPRLAPKAHGSVGRPAPDVTFPIAHNGEPNARLKLSELKGQPVILDFWATWCGPCVMQSGILERVAKRHAADGLVVVGINVDTGVEGARAFAQKKGLTYPIVLDENETASGLYEVTRLPSLVVIDRQGNVSSYLVGLVDESSLEEAVAKAM